MAKEKKHRGPIGELVSTLIWALGIALILRTFLFQPFHIPSGSMQPGLMKGDYLITSKYSVGYGRHAAAPLPFPVKNGRLFERGPTRGDVVVFRAEGDNKNLIKRIVGLPGDQIQMISGVLHINGEKLLIEPAGEEIRLDRYGNDDPVEVQLETLPGGDKNRIYDDLKNSPADNTAVFTVPAGHYFAMGDNRDHSADSRVPVSSGGAGYIPAEGIIGKAEIILASAQPEFSIRKPWTWFKLRGDRFFKRID